MKSKKNLAIFSRYSALIYDAPNINHVWAKLIVEELIRNGVSVFCLSPGSRSTPLASAVVNHPEARFFVHFDERGSAFRALGHARATGIPAVWITTSGTAVANGLPAVWEAYNDRVPLLLLTADRPPEAHQSDANQTVSQGGKLEPVRWYHQFPCPEPGVDPATVLSTIDQAVHQALNTAGPVHLNLPFREPLAPDPEPFSILQSVVLSTVWEDSGRPYTRYTSSHGPGRLPSALRSEIADARHGLIIAGKLNSQEEARSVLDLSRHLAWPVLADAASGLRLSDTGNVIAHQDLVLRDAAFADSHPPDVVLQFGSRFTSARLLKWLTHVRPAVYAVIKDHPFRSDPAHITTDQIQSGPVNCCRTLISDLEKTRSTPSWLEDWLRANDRCAVTLKQKFDADDTLTEPAVSHLVSSEVDAGHALFLANSMPVRDFDRFAAAPGKMIPVGVNRGVSGIDGTVATAIGYSTGLQRALTLIIGDLALLHDLNSLSMLSTASWPVTIIVINNDGGGIFSMLPISGFPDVFEPAFGTPHGWSFEGAANMFKLDYYRPDTLSTLRGAYQSCQASRRSAIIEVKTDRAENAVFQKELLSLFRGTA